MTVKDSRKGQVTCRNKQTNECFLHSKQLNAFDHPYHIHKYLVNLEPSCWLIGTLFSTNLLNIFSYI